MEAGGQAAHDDDKERLWREYLSSRSREARERLVLAYLPLVRSIVGGLARRLPPGVEMGDLIGEEGAGCPR
ncbi:MAG: hypothetical protein QJR14_10945 [Bacillota bacterium]|nr:hypothetical protein [Bacillota bacterium]